VGKDTDTHRTVDWRGTSWVRYLLIALVAEKIVQHIAVTLAFYLNWADIGSAVAMDPGIVMVLGGLVAVLYVLSLWGLIVHRRGTLTLIVALALFDIVGEFVAQGTTYITITVSFLAALVLLILAFLHHRLEQRRLLSG
jgi:hypothetical protein